MTRTEHRIPGGCIRLTVNDAHVAHVLNVRRKMERFGIEQRTEKAA